MSYRVYSSPTATIALNQTVSSEVDTKGLHAIGVQLPATFTGTAVSFQRAKDTGGTFGAVQNISGTGTYSVPCAAGQYIPLDPVVMLGIQFLKVVSNASEGGSRAIEVVCVPVVR